MDQPTKNTLHRLTKISRYLAGQPAAVASLAALAESVAEFEALRAALPAVPADNEPTADAPTTGAQYSARRAVIRSAAGSAPTGTTVSQDTASHSAPLTSLAPEYPRARTHRRRRRWPSR